MLAVRALYHDGKLEWLEPPPEDAQGMVAVVFLEAEQAQDADTREADMLAASPNFRRLMERSKAYLVAEETRPIQALLDELPARKSTADVDAICDRLTLQGLSQGL